MTVWNACICCSHMQCPMTVQNACIFSCPLTSYSCPQHWSQCFHCRCSAHRDDDCHSDRWGHPHNHPDTGHTGYLATGMLQSTGGKQAKTKQQQLPNREYLRGGKTRRKINPQNGTILLAEIYTSPSLVHKAVCVHVYEIRKARMQFDKKEGVCVWGGGFCKRYFKLLLQFSLLLNKFDVCLIRCG